MIINKNLDSVVRVENGAKTGKVRLNTGEMVPPLHPMFGELLSSFQLSDITEYPDTTELITRLAARHGVNPKNVMLTPGSDQGISMVFQAFGVNGRVAFPEYSFPMYEVYANQNGAKISKLKYSGNLLDPKLNLAGASECDLVVLANPQSPTGECVSVEDVHKASNDNVILLDMAYYEFSNSSLPISLIDSNVIFSFSMSKTFGIPGARVGYLIANDFLISKLKKLRHMFEVTGTSVKAAMWALANEWVLGKYRTAINHESVVLGEMGFVAKANWVFLPTSLAPLFVNCDVKTVNLFGTDCLRVTVFPGLAAYIKKSEVITANPCATYWH